MSNFTGDSDWTRVFSPNMDIDTWDIVNTYAAHFSNEFLEKIHHIAIPGSQPVREECLTNCVTNGVALSVLFSELESARNMLGTLPLGGGKKIKTRGDSGVIRIHVEDLQLGSIICSYTPEQVPFDKNGSFDLSGIVKVAQTIDRPFILHMDSVLKETSLDMQSIADAYLNKIFDFNRFNYEFLLQDIKKNSDLLTRDKGFVYNLAITKTKDNIRGYVHHFVIEQFLGKGAKPCYRVYQSFIGLYSLQANLKFSESHGIGRAGMDQDTFAVFLKNLAVIVCASGNMQGITLEDAYAHCFQSTPTAKARQKLSFKNDTITIHGISFRYQYSAYDKKKILDNLYTFLKQHSMLELFLRKPQKIATIDSVIQKKFFQPTYQSAIPFRVIHFLSNKHLKLLVPAVLQEINPSYHNRSEDKLITSCVNTAFTVAALFLGLKKTQEIVPSLHIDPNFATTYTLSSGQVLRYSVYNLFSGIALCNIRKAGQLETILSSEKQKVDVTSFVKSEIGMFFKAVESTLSNSIRTTSIHTTLNPEFDTTLLSKMKYENNTAVIANLKSELFAHESQITSTKSYIYFVAALTYKMPRNFDHAFVLEQFLRETDQKVCYRLYQSWIGRATLVDDIQRQWYGEEGENALTKEELIVFLKELGNLYGFQGTEGSYAKCFGYYGSTLSPILKFENNQFTGKTISYLAYEIDPRDCLNHLGEIMGSDAKLKEAFLKESI